METVKAVKSFGGKEESREFSQLSWDSGTPAKNGWRKVDYDTTVLARKLPEFAEIANKKAAVTEVQVPPMPTIPELQTSKFMEGESADLAAVTEVHPVSTPAEVSVPVEPAPEDKPKRGPKKKN